MKYPDILKIINQKLLRDSINLIKIYPNEWSDLLQLLSIEEQVKQKFQGRIKGIIET